MYKNNLIIWQSKEKKLKNLNLVMLVYFTDSETNSSIAVNLNQLVCVFTVKEEGAEKTILNMLNGNLAIKEAYLDAVGRINAELR